MGCSHAKIVVAPDENDEYFHKPLTPTVQQNPTTTNELFVNNKEGLGSQKRDQSNENLLSKQNSQNDNFLHSPAAVLSRTNTFLRQLSNNNNTSPPPVIAPIIPVVAPTPGLSPREDPPAPLFDKKAPSFAEKRTKTMSFANLDIHGDGRQNSFSAAGTSGKRKRPSWTEKILGMCGFFCVCLCLVCLLCLSVSPIRNSQHIKFDVIF